MSKENNDSQNQKPAFYSSTVQPNNPYLEAAIHWSNFGFSVLPILPNCKIPAVRWSWATSPYIGKNKFHWRQYPKHEVGCLLDDRLFVLDADTPAAVTALYQLEDVCSLASKLIIKTTRGEHHYFRRAEGSYAKSDSYSTEKYPERLDIKTGRSMMILPPSGGKEVLFCGANHRTELSLATQKFIDAVFWHNGRLAPRPDTPKAEQDESNSRSSPSELTKLISYLDPDDSYDTWIRVGMAIHHETNGNDDGMDIFNAWSQTGSKYRGFHEINSKWQSFNNHRGRPITIATIFMLLKDQGIDLMQVRTELTPKFELCETIVINPKEGVK